MSERYSCQVLHTHRNSGPQTQYNGGVCTGHGTKSAQKMTSSSIKFAIELACRRTRRRLKANMAQ